MFDQFYRSFSLEIWDWKLNKNDSNFSKQFVKKACFGKR